MTKWQRNFVARYIWIYFMVVLFAGPAFGFLQPDWTSYFFITGEYIALWFVVVTFVTLSYKWQARKKNPEE